MTLSESDLYRAADPRIQGEFNKTVWMGELRRRLFNFHKGRSSLTLQPLDNGFEVHESIFPRRYVPRSVSWGHYLFSGINSMILRPEEHRPNPPDRVMGYWIACIYYGKPLVDRWIDSLPFKVTPDKPWVGTDPADVLERIAETFAVHPDWHRRMTWDSGISRHVANGMF